jgi:hypothetical protein
VGQNTYILYQTCQKEFTTWLVEAAAELGEVVKESTSLNIEASVVPFDQLMRLARAVGKHGVVPQAALNTLDFIIYVYRGNPGNDIEQDGMTATPTSSYGQHPELDTILELRSLLGSAVIIPASDEDSGPDSAGYFRIDKEKKVNQITDVYSLPPQSNEALVAWELFFGDLGRIRRFLMDNTKDYLESLTSSTTGALVANTAIRLIRANCRAQINATRHLPGMPLEYDLIRWLCQARTGDFQSTHVFREKWQNYEAAFYCFEAQINLEETIQHLSGRSSAAVKPTNNLDGKELSQGRAVTIEALVKNTCFCFHKAFAMANRRDAEDTKGRRIPVLLPCYDEISRGWFVAYIQQKIPLWVAVAFQIFVDIKIATGAGQYAFDDLKETSEESISLIREYLSSYDCTERRKRTDRGNMPDLLQVTQLVAQCIRNKGYYKMSHILYANNSLLCGMQSWWISQRLRSFADWAVKLHESIIPAGLLYSLMRSKGLIGNWKDMSWAGQYLESPTLLPRSSASS